MPFFEHDSSNGAASGVLSWPSTSFCDRLPVSIGIAVDRATNYLRKKVKSARHDAIPAIDLTKWELHQAHGS